jgi:hypothetical protein
MAIFDYFSWILYCSYCQIQRNDMIFNLSQSLVFPKYAARWLTTVAICGMQGCFSPMALDRAVIEYDKATTNILSKQLLLNIARAHQHQPLHFTGVSNIAATFNFQFNAGCDTRVYRRERLVIDAGVWRHAFRESDQPQDAESFRLFRQAVLHLSSIQDRHKLFVEPLLFDQYWT